MAELGRLARKGGQCRTQATPTRREEEARFSKDTSKEHVTGLLDPLDFGAKE